ncbi:MAG: metalloregulator ArsR/SmtB family transcription factor [Bryobacter sp.]|jgi:DNA-binding transcriptional ArsR family regulator|nr:metalloregulator ArsR/SmtB family transcription factor [Bryobacter sp. CoA8 C33]
MPWRALLTKEMGDFLGILAHPHRIRIIQELRNKELDVNGLQSVLEISHSRVSQHLSVLRSHHVVMERREGRHVFYRLLQPSLAQWLSNGLEFLRQESAHHAEVSAAVTKSKSLWPDASSGSELKWIQGVDGKIKEAALGGDEEEPGG